MRQRLPSFRAGSSLLWIILRIVRIGRFSNLAACSGVRNGVASALLSMHSSPFEREFERLLDEERLSCRFADCNPTVKIH